MRLLQWWRKRRKARVRGDNPYLEARRVWNDHVGRVVAARSLWQLVALASLFLAMLCVGTVAHLATRSKFIPYVVEVDQSGHVEALKRAIELPPAPRATIEAQLDDFITRARRVTTDRAMQVDSIRRVFRMLAADDPATTKLREYLQGERHPLRRAERETVATKIISILPESEGTWQVDWSERVYNRKGVLKEEFRMRAYLEVYQSQPAWTDEAALEANPLGIYIKDYNWSRLRPRKVAR